MLAAGALLGQVRPGDTNNATLYTAVLGTEVTRIVVCNVSGSPATFRLFHDQGGSTYDQTNALRYDVSVANGAFAEIIGGSEGAGLQLEVGDTIGVRSSVLDALVFTAYGQTEKLAEPHPTLRHAEGN